MKEIAKYFWAVALFAIDMMWIGYSIKDACVNGLTDCVKTCGGVHIFILIFCIMSSLVYCTCTEQ